MDLPPAKTSRDFEEQGWRLLDVCSKLMSVNIAKDQQWFMVQLKKSVEPGLSELLGLSIFIDSHL